MEIINNTTPYINSVPQQTVLLLLMLPIVATITAFVRQVVGIRTFGAYAPIITAFAFVGTGIIYGLLITIIVYLVGSFVRILVRDFRLHYLPRMSLVLTVISFTVLTVLFLSSYLGKDNVTHISIFPLLLLITLADTFVSTQIQKGAQVATVLYLETIVTAAVAFFIITWNALDNLVLQYPELVLLTIFLNILIGRWTGLRLVEYWRFKKLLSSSS